MAAPESDTRAGATRLTYVGHGTVLSEIGGARVLTDFWRHPDCLEGPAAFAEKREARWAPPIRDL